MIYRVINALSQADLLGGDPSGDVFTSVVVISHGNTATITFARTPSVTIELTAETETEHNKKLDSRAFMSRP